MRCHQHSPLSCGQWNAKEPHAGDIAGYLLDLVSRESTCYPISGQSVSFSEPTAFWFCFFFLQMPLSSSGNQRPWNPEAFRFHSFCPQGFLLLKVAFLLFNVFVEHLVRFYLNLELLFLLF